MVGNRPDVVVATYYPQVGAPFDLKFQAQFSATDSGGAVTLQGIEGNGGRFRITKAQLLEWLAAIHAAQVAYSREQFLAN